MCSTPVLPKTLHDTFWEELLKGSHTSDLEIWETWFGSHFLEQPHFFSTYRMIDWYLEGVYSYMEGLITNVMFGVWFQVLSVWFRVSNAIKFVNFVYFSSLTHGCTVTSCSLPWWWVSIPTLHLHMRCHVVPLQLGATPPLVSIYYPKEAVEYLN